MSEQPQLTHLRVDDIPLLLGLLMQMEIAALYDRVASDHKKHQGLGGGWMLTIWPAFVISRGDRIKYKVEDSRARASRLVGADHGAAIQVFGFQ